MVSRILGFARDVLMARYLGAALVADCFFVAFKLPNFFRRLFAEGAFNSAFVPVFASEMGDGDKEGRARARLFAEQAIAILIPILLVFTILMQVAMPWVMLVLAGGFADEPDKFELAIAFTRTTFPYLMLVSLVSLLAGVLASLQRSAAAAAAPILLNMMLIGALIGFHDTQLSAGWALSVAVTLAGLLQFVWLYVACSRAGFRLNLRLPRITPRIREFAIVFFPAALGAGAVQVNLVIDVIIASYLPEGSLSFLFYADRLNQLPIGIIGVAIGTVLLPLLSKRITAGDTAGAAESQNRAIELALLLTLPAAAALVVIPGPLISVLFERGAFSASDTVQTAAALSAYALGLPAYVLAKALVPGFFARKDTRTPLRISIISLSVNTILNLILMGPLQHVGLALATAIAAWLNVVLLYAALNRRNYFKMDTRLKKNAARTLMATSVMALCVWALAGELTGWLVGGLLYKVLAVSALVVGGMAVYVIAGAAFGVMRKAEIRTLLGKSDGSNP